MSPMIYVRQIRKESEALPQAVFSLLAAKRAGFTARGYNRPAVNHHALFVPARSHMGSASGRAVSLRMAALVAAFVCAALAVPALGLTSSSAPRLSPATASNLNFAGRLPIGDLDQEQSVLHALDRLGFGPSPGEVARIEQSGLEAWIAQQLHPETIDDSAMDARLANLPVLQLSAQALLDQYPPVDVAAKRAGMSQDDYRKQLQQLAHPAQGMHAPPSSDPQEIPNELAQARMLRAIYSQRQLQEQLVNFWFNHFNVYAQKDQDRWYIAPYERDAIRPHVLGKFRDLLEATAKSPAMQFYLDNWLSADPDAFARIKQHPQEYRAQSGAPPLGGKRGLNENYGRELMELHTLGVDGGYTQQDVIEVARCFTGWTIASPRENPQFFFDYRIHDPGEKRVLGKKIHAGGIRDGEQVLDLLAKDPHTARHISLELAQYFVADEPPAALVDRMAKTWKKSNGDLREVMRTMIDSPEFWSRAAYRAKVKTPFELVASAARALGADVDQAQPLVSWSARIGEPLYQCLPPDGYSDKTQSWVSTGALLNRLNFAIALASNHIRGTAVELTPLVGGDVGADPQKALDRVMNLFLGEGVSGATRATLERESHDPKVTGAKLDDPIREVNLGVLSGLVLGAPEFQQR
ncbi:MAG: DUF1800 domain-containing protein [Candidatus Acidiferrales bacterium]